MPEYKVVNTLYQLSLYYEPGRSGDSPEPPEDWVRKMLVLMLVTMARAIEHSSWGGDIVFPLEFPMRLTIESELLRWDLQLRMKLESAGALKAVQDA